MSHIQKSILISFFSFLFIFCFSTSISAKYLTRNDLTTIPTLGKYSLTYHIKNSVMLFISIKELQNNKIKFNVLQDGKIIYRSKVRRGLVTAKVAVEKGTISLVIINNNLLKKKKVLVTVSAELLSTGMSLFFKKNRFSQIIDENKRKTIRSNQAFHMSYILRRTAKIYIKVTEAFGKNIEFRVVQDGTTLYHTGVVRGGTKAIVKVFKGKFKIIITNKNLLSSKTVDYFVAVLR